MEPEKSSAKTILVADDDQAILTFVSGFLKHSGFQILTASSGEDALKHSREYEGTIDLLLSNIQMPGMTGIELGTKINAERPQTKVMLMSGFAAGMLVLNSGWHFLPKPFLPSQLRDIVLNVLASASSVDIPDLDEQKTRSSGSTA